MDLKEQKQILKDLFNLNMREIVTAHGHVLLVVSGPKITLADGKKDSAWEVRARNIDLGTLNAVRSYYPWRNNRGGLFPKRHNDFVTAVAHAMSENERAGLGAKENQ